MSDQTGRNRSQFVCWSVSRGEFKIEDIPSASGVVRDACTVFVHPAHVEAALRAGHSVEPAIRNTMRTLNVAFSTGVTFEAELTSQTTI